jgi:hypothetical protein
MTPHPSRRRSRPHHPLVRATESAWPVLAGAVAAVGLAGSIRQYGIIALVVIYAGSAVLTMVMVYAAYAEGDVSNIPIVRIGLGAALAFVVALGVMMLFPVAGWCIALVVVATSPLVTSRLPERRRTSDGSNPAAARLVPQDQTLVDRAFQRVVADLVDDPSWRHDAP